MIMIYGYYLATDPVQFFQPESLLCVKHQQLRWYQFKVNSWALHEVATLQNIPQASIWSNHQLKFATPCISSDQWTRLRQNILIDRSILTDNLVIIKNRCRNGTDTSSHITFSWRSSSNTKRHKQQMHGAITKLPPTLPKWNMHLKILLLCLYWPAPGKPSAPFLCLFLFTSF